MKITGLIPDGSNAFIFILEADRKTLGILLPGWRPPRNAPVLRRAGAPGYRLLLQLTAAPAFRCARS
jgi:hypothetical protein